jgi:MFS family permease
MLSADAISMAGNAAALVAIPWFVLQTTGSASKTGITAAAAIVPVIISGLFGGPYVDRLGYRRASIVSDLASFAAVAAIPLLHATVGLAFWQLVLLYSSGRCSMHPASLREHRCCPRSPSLPDGASNE